jgi:hypothetical protein
MADEKKMQTFATWRRFGDPFHDFSAEKSHGFCRRCPAHQEILDALPPTSDQSLALDLTMAADEMGLFHLFHLVSQ